jgi:hypothetical protein
MIQFGSGITIGPNLIINLPPPGFAATGGTITTNANGLYTIHTFTANDTLTLYNTQNKTFDVLLVGAGGGSVNGGSATGGGGAGGVAYIPGISIYAGDYAVTYNVSIGQGLAGANGQNSSFSTYVALGGGAGGGQNLNGSAGGSGGGGGGLGLGAAALQPSSSTGGYGASGISSGSGLAAGRGGGAGTDGWNGRAFDISGTSTYYGGGGGRGRRNGQGGGETTHSLGGGGWGGGGNSPGANATAGSPNTGGGAGGWGTSTGTDLAGGSGIIIIRYLN